MARDRQDRYPTAQRDSDTVGGSQHSQPATGGGRDTAAIADSRGNLHLLPYADAAAGTYTYGDGCRVIVFDNGDCVFIPVDYTGPGHSSRFAYDVTYTATATDTDAATSAQSVDLHSSTGMRSAVSTSDLSTDS